MTFMMIFFMPILRDWAFIILFLLLIIYPLNQFLIFININFYFFIIIKVSKVFFLIYLKYLSLLIIILHTNSSIYYTFFQQPHLILYIIILNFKQLQFISNIINSYLHGINFLIQLPFNQFLQLIFILFKLN